MMGGGMTPRGRGRAHDVGRGECSGAGTTRAQGDSGRGATRLVHVTVFTRFAVRLCKSRESSTEACHRGLSEKCTAPASGAFGDRP